MRRFRASSADGAQAEGNDFKIQATKSKAARNEIQAGRNEIQISRNEIQIIPISANRDFSTA
jgi:hypothetical protein